LRYFAGRTEEEIAELIRNNQSDDDPPTPTPMEISQLLARFIQRLRDAMRPSPSTAAAR
jgi:hypothetical protein